MRQQLRSADLLAVDAAALLEVHQVRLGIQADAVAGLQADGFEHRAGRTLAVGAGDRDHRRIEPQAETFGHPAHPIEGQVDLFRVQPLAAGEPVGQRGWQGRGTWAAHTTAAAL